MRKIISMAISLFMVFFLCGNVAAAEMPDNNNINLTVANDLGVRFNNNGDNTYSYFKGLDNNTGGLNAIRISDDNTTAAKVTFTSAQSGTFYIANVGGKGYSDNGILMLAINGTLPEDFQIHITASGYQWTPNATGKPNASAVSYNSTTLNETFDINDFIYGPQTWKPYYAANYPLFEKQDMTNLTNTFNIILIDLYSGMLNPSTYPGLINNGTIKVEYSFTHLPLFTLATFNAFGYSLAPETGQTTGGIAWTNKVNTATQSQTQTSGYYVNGIASTINVYPGQSIQQAINSAASGDNIIIHGNSGNPNTYTENIIVNHLLNITSAGDGEVTVNAYNTSQPVFLISNIGSGSTIHGFNITGGWTGICLDNSSGNTLTRNNIYNNQEGILLSNSLGNAINGNNIHNNINSGLDILNGSTGNTISSNTAISNNGIIGILIRDSNNNIITGNTIGNNGWAGIALDEADGNTITGANIISGNLEGLYLTGSVGNTITSSTISNNINIGISLINSSNGNFITSNTSISTNGIIGVYLRDSGTNTISGNPIQSNGWVGICLDNSASNIINSSNNIFGNMEGLYLVNNSNSNTITSNNIHNNTDTGIYIENSTGNQITNNTDISANNVIGILLRNAHTNIISGNTLTNNNWVGIALDNADNNNNINGTNTISGSQMGIYIVNTSAGNNITGNTLQNNTWAGLVLDNASNTTIDQNNFINNPLQALAQNGTGNAFYQGTTGNYWSDWPSTDRKFIAGDENLYDEYPSINPFL